MAGQEKEEKGKDQAPSRERARQRKRGDSNPHLHSRPCSHLKQRRNPSGPMRRGNTPSKEQAERGILREVWISKSAPPQVLLPESQDPVRVRRGFIRGSKQTPEDGRTPMHRDQRMRAAVGAKPRVCREEGSAVPSTNPGISVGPLPDSPWVWAPVPAAATAW